MSLAHRFISGASFSVIAATATKGAAFLGSIILARLLGANDFGMFAIVNSMVNMLVVFSIFGLNTAATKLISEFVATNKERVGGLISSSVLLCVLIAVSTCLCIFLFSGEISIKVYSNRELEPALKISAFYLFFSTLTALGIGIVQGFQRFKVHAMVSVFSSLLVPPMVLLFAWRWQLQGAVLAWAVIFLVKSTILVFAIKSIARKAEVNLGLSRLVPQLSLMLGFALPIFLMSIVVAPAHWLSYTYLARTLGFDQVAMFNVANAVSRLVMFVPMIALAPILPIFSEIEASGEKRRFSILLGRNVKLVWLFTMPSVVLACCLSRVGVSLLYGSQYSGAFLPACIMLFTALLMVISSTAGKGIISSSERVWHGFGLNLLWFVTFVTCSYFLIPLGGALGLSLAFFISYTVYSVAVWLYSVSVMKTDFPQLFEVITLTIISAVISLMVASWLAGVWVWLTGAACAFLLIAIEWRFFLGGNERGLILERLQHFKSKLVAVARR